MSFNIKHDVILKNLESRIKGYGRYTDITTNFEYNTGVYNGEVDLLAYDSKFNIWHFYEVKSSSRPARIFKAYEQYNRFKKAFPNLKTKGILVNNKGVYRL